ncbi:MAG: DUF1467 family protein [Pseudomonadota bacterium]
MNIGAAIVVYVLIWWCVFFAVLPFGLRRGDEAGADGLSADAQSADAQQVAGADAGAPANPRLKEKALSTTGISAVLWVIAVAIIMSGLINFRD